MRADPAARRHRCSTAAGRSAGPRSRRGRPSPSRPGARIARTITATTMAAPPICHRFRPPSQDALLVGTRPLARTGGGAAAYAWRCRLFCLPLGMGLMFAQVGGILLSGSCSPGPRGKQSSAILSALSSAEIGRARPPPASGVSPSRSVPAPRPVRVVQQPGAGQAQVCGLRHAAHAHWIRQLRGDPRPRSGRRGVSLPRGREVARAAEPAIGRDGCAVAGVQLEVQVGVHPVGVA